MPRCQREEEREKPNADYARRSRDDFLLLGCQHGTAGDRLCANGMGWCVCGRPLLSLTTFLGTLNLFAPVLVWAPPEVGFRDQGQPHPPLAGTG